jgi:hypothetical protein
MIYSYEELKNVIKVGDEVRAVPGKYNPCAELNNDGSNTQKITKVDDEGFRINGCWHAYYSDRFLELLPSEIAREITWDNLEKGDVLEFLGGKYTVLARLEDLVFLSSEHRTPGTSPDIYTIHELQNFGHPIVQPEKEEKAEEMTLQEIEKVIGHKVKIVKEK